MDLPTATQHQVNNGLPDANQETGIPQRDHAVLDFTTHTGSHLAGTPRAAISFRCALCMSGQCLQGRMLGCRALQRSG